MVFSVCSCFSHTSLNKRNNDKFDPTDFLKAFGYDSDKSQFVSIETKNKTENLIKMIKYS